MKNSHNVRECSLKAMKKLVFKHSTYNVRIMFIVHITFYNIFKTFGNHIQGVVSNIDILVGFVSF